MHDYRYKACFSCSGRSTGVSVGSALIYYLYSLKTELTKCLLDYNIWMTDNFLKLNTKKTEVLVVGSRSVLSKTQPFNLLISNSLVNASTQVNSLGVIFDGLLSFGSSIDNISRTVFT